MSDRTRIVSDLAMAVFLNVAGHPLQGIQRLDGRGGFVFTESEALERDILRYLNRQAAVEPMGYAEGLRNLKAAVRAA